MANAFSVLLIDDDPFSRIYVRKLLAKAGVRHILEAGNGIDAMKIVSTNEISLVFLDINMEPGNGLQFLKAIRTGRTKAACDLRIIMMTSNHRRDVFEAAAALDCNAFLLKPTSQKQIGEKILFVMGRPTSTRPQLAYDVVPLPDPRGRSPLPLKRAMQSETVVLPTHLDGFDLAASLQRLNGDRALLAGLLADFPKWAEMRVQNLKKALADGDTATAGKIAHTLRGTAATVAAIDVQAAATAFEAAALQEETEALPGLLARIAASVAEAIVRLQASLSPGGTAMDREIDGGLLSEERGLLPEEEGVLEDLLQELRSLLDRRDFDACSHFDRIRTLYGRRRLPAPLARIGDQLAVLAFSQAAQALEELDLPSGRGEDQ